MKFHVGLPTDRVDAGAEFVSADGIAVVARAAEDAGFDSVFVTEHPYPEDAWLASGGHHALDPFVALSFAASATTTVRLLTNLCVVPYRNPFLVAKAAMTLDVLSGGRLTLGVGAGYLEPEFRALGVDFEERNELLDEGLVAIKRAWTESGVTMTGRHFDVRGHTMLPRPVQSPHPPIWVGGNSKRAIRRGRPRRRMVAHAEPAGVGCTAPVGASRNGRRARRRSSRTRTGTERRPAMSGSFEVSVMPMGVPGPGFPGYEPARFLDHVSELESFGIGGVVLMLPQPTRDEIVDAIAQFGSEVIELASTDAK